VTHLDGRGIHVDSPAGKIIKPGDSIVIRGEGMPVFKNPEQKGNLYVVFKVDMPDDQWLQNADQKALQSMLPPKKKDVEPRPAVVDQAAFELSDIAEARGKPFSDSTDFFDHGDEDDWEDEDDEDEMGEPECRPQ